jgi:hypothetical protein
MMLKAPSCSQQQHAYYLNHKGAGVTKGLQCSGPCGPVWPCVLVSCVLRNTRALFKEKQ